MNGSRAESQKDLPGIFSIPIPLKTLFDKLPVLIYPPNRLPQRSSTSENLPSLYVFSREGDAATGKPSYNPSCLKWQTFLRIAGIQHNLIASNNHASPTGSLPFLLPALHDHHGTHGNPKPIAANKIETFARDHGMNINEPVNMRYQAYQSLLDHRIRNAWLYFLYLDPRNFSSIAYPLYIAPVSSSQLVRASISYQLRTAAQTELLKHSPVVDMDDLYHEADKAFEGLSILLADDTWFFGNKTPTLFDASVFAYSQLLLDENLGWKETKLCRSLRSRENLVNHREMILQEYYMDK